MKKKDDFVDISSSSKSRNNLSNKKKSVKPVKKHYAIKAFICILSIMSIGIGGISIYAANYVFGNITTNSITKDREELGIAEDTASVDNITNIALFGIDSRGTNFTGRADTIIVLTIDEINKKVKMTSILRDSRVYMGEDYYTDTGWDKINHAYNYGPEFAIKVINSNFGLDIQDYVTVNFHSVENIVNALGGIDLEITAAEAEVINGLLVYSDPVPSSGGYVHLNGEQALSYSRIRVIDNDSARVERQYKVMSALVDKIVEMPVSEYPAIISELSSYVELSLDVTEILSYTPFVASGFEMENIHVPDYEFDNPGSGYFEGGGWMWDYDLDAASDRIAEFIYGEFAE